jgi:hypothetical protein
VQNYEGLGRKTDLCTVIVLLPIKKGSADDCEPFFQSISINPKTHYGNTKIQQKKSEVKKNLNKKHEKKTTPAND